MSANTQPSDIDSLLSELDAEFGKKKPGRPRASKEPEHKALNRSFHQANPQVRFAKTQLDSLKFENYYDWEMHRQALIEGDLALQQAAGVPELQWLPEAHVVYVIKQWCACCKESTRFVGNEYVRFRSRRRKYRDINGREHETYSTRLIQIRLVDPNLLAFGIPGGDLMPSLVEYQEETVARCAGCIELENAALDLWIAATQPNPQHELDIDIPLSENGL